MPDYGHEIRFGITLSPLADRLAEVVRLAALADELGLDLIGVQDHPYQPAYVDTWTLLTHLAAKTRRVTLFPDVANLPLWSPAALAKAAASLDILSDGRVELGLRSAASGESIGALGGQRRTQGEAMDALEEAIAVLRSLWTPGPDVRIDGRFYELYGARPGPFPVHPIGIWLGGYETRMLRLIGRVADGWVPSSSYAPPEQLAVLSRVLDEAAVAAGRDPAMIRRIYNLTGRFEKSATAHFLIGPAARWAKQLGELALERGISGFVLFVGGPDAERDLRVFAEEVAPLVRAEVDSVRGRAAPAPAVPADPLDEAGRPRVTKPNSPPDAAQRHGSGQRLVLVHANLRNELRQIREAVAQVAAGRRTAAQARSMINELTLRQNYWALGSFCASYCRVLTMHHTIEDEVMLPELAARLPALAPVVKQLEREHEVIAGLLVELDAVLVAAIRDGARIDDVRERVRVLDRVLTSHLDYEEEQLVEPLNRLDLDL